VNVSKIKLLFWGGGGFPMKKNFWESGKLVFEKWGDRKIGAKSVRNFTQITVSVHYY